MRGGFGNNKELPPFRLVGVWLVLQLPLGRLITAYQQLAGFGGVLSCQRAARQMFSCSEVAWSKMIAAATEFKALCQQIGLAVTELAAARACAELGRGVLLPNGQWGFSAFEDLARAENALNQMCGCMRNESITKAAMMLPSDKLKLFEPTAPLFGAETGEPCSPRSRANWTAVGHQALLASLEMGRRLRLCTGL